jgi:hypothetical protein
MSSKNILQLIDLGFSNDLNKGMPAFRKLYEEVNDFSDEERDYLFSKVYSISRLDDPLFDLLLNIIKKVIKNNAKQFPINYYINTDNVIAYKLICSLYPSLDVEIQNEYIETLFNKLIYFTPESQQFQLLRTFFISYKNDLFLNLSEHYITNKYDYKVAHLIEILTNNYNVEICDSLKIILENSLIGINYEGRIENIKSNILEFINKNKYILDVKLIRTLLSKNKDSYDNCIFLSKILIYSCQNFEEILDYLEYDIKNKNDKLVEGMINTLYELNASELKNLNYGRLLMLVHPNKQTYYPLYHKLVIIFSKMDESQEYLLLPLLKSEVKGEVEFSLSIFQSKPKKLVDVIGINPLLKIYTSFYVPNVFNEENQFNFLEKRKLNPFDFKIYLLFTFSGFNVLIVDPPSKIPNIDLIAFSPYNEEIFLIGCTTGIIKDDASQLFAYTQKIRETLPTFKITPIICTALKSNEILDVKKIVDNKIGILTGEKIDVLIDMIQNNPLHSKILFTLQNYLNVP